MRFKILEKGTWVSIIFGTSENPEKSFKRTCVCIQEGDKVYKVLSLSASKKDGSLSVFFDYCKEKKAFIFRHKHTYKPGLQDIDESKITDEFEITFDVDRTAKLSLHQSGFVQLSGKGVTSGIDPKTGKPKGVGVFSSPLATPVSSGPTFGYICWGLEKGFEQLQKQESGVQYLILNGSDFTKRPSIEPNKAPNSYVLEFFIFPKAANDYVYESQGRIYINHVMTGYIHKPGALMAHSVLDVQYFEGVIAVFPVTSWTGHPETTECGYLIGSPGGSDSLFDESKVGYNFHLICPADKKKSITSREVGTLHRT